MVGEKTFYQKVNKLIKLHSRNKPDYSFKVLFLDWSRTEEVIENLCNYLEQLGVCNTNTIASKFFNIVIEKSLNIYLKTIYIFDEESPFYSAYNTDIKYDGDAVFRLKVFIKNLICYSIIFMNTYLKDFKKIEVATESFKRLENLLYNEITSEKLKQVLNENDGYEKTLVYNNNYIIS